MPGPTSRRGLSLNPNTAMAGLFPAPSFYLARTGAGALLTPVTTPQLTAPANNIVWDTATTGVAVLPFQSAIASTKRSGGFRIALYVRIPAGAATVTILVTPQVNVGSIGGLTQPAFAPTTFTKTITTGGQYTIKANDAGALIQAVMPAPAAAGHSSLMVLHGLNVNVSVNDTIVTLMGVEVRAL